MDESQSKDILKFQIRRKISSLCKLSLSLIEEMSEKDIKIVNIMEQLKVRKKILDNGNDGIRELEELIDRL